MKLYMCRGCVCGALEIDDKNVNDLTDEEKSKVLDYLLGHSNIRRLYNPWDVEQFIYDLCELFGEYKNLGTCSQCNDLVEEYTLYV